MPRQSAWCISSSSCSSDGSISGTVATAEALLALRASFFFLPLLLPLPHTLSGLPALASRYAGELVWVWWCGCGRSAAVSVRRPSVHI